MDIASFLIDCALFGVKLYVSRLLYKAYETNAECFKSLKEAPCFEINSRLRKEVVKNGGVIKYAAISGSIKALAAPLKSQYAPHIEGVIQEKVTKEHKVKWIRYLGSWTSVSDRQYTIDYAPFALCSKTSDLFKKQTCVEVIEPLIAQGFDVPRVADYFSFYNISDAAAVAAFSGERIKTIQETEGILSEGVTLTAIGKLIIENNEVKITQPDNGFKYILTPLSKGSLIYKVHLRMGLLKAGCIMMSTITFISFIYISCRVFSIIRRKIARKKKFEEQRKLRRMADSSCGLQNINVPKCVICLHYPVEVLLLECGHGCLCYDCSPQIKNCPVCRNPNVRSISTFWPFEPLATEPC